MCLADLASSYVTKKADDFPIEPEEIKSFTIQVWNIDDVKLNPNIIVWKNDLGEMQKCSWPFVSFLQSVWTEKPRRVLLETSTVIYA